MLTFRFTVWFAKLTSIVEDSILPTCLLLLFREGSLGVISDIFFLISEELVQCGFFDSLDSSYHAKICGCLKEFLKQTNDF